MKKKNQKNEKTKEVGPFLIQKLEILISVHVRAEMLQDVVLGERKACSHLQIPF